jgi:hypothetical protein
MKLPQYIMTPEPFSTAYSAGWSSEKALYEIRRKETQQEVSCSRNDFHGLGLRIATEHATFASLLFVSWGTLLVREREREESWGVLVRDTTVWRGV